MGSRNWLVLDDALRDPAARALFDTAVARIRTGTAQLNLDYPPGVIVEESKLLGSAVLDYGVGIGAGQAEKFDAALAWDFTEKTRSLLGWNTLSYTLRTWVEHRLCEPFFVNTGSDWNKRWELRPDADPSNLPDSFFEFACKVALGELKYGPSYASVSADEIFAWVAALGSDLPARLKKHGSGDLPPELARFQSETVTASANDALAVIRITLKDETAAAYRTALEYVLRLLTTTDFPRSYAIEFRGPTKAYLPIPGIPKKGVHRLFACASAYAELHPLIAQYAREAMRGYEWYTNIDDENCAMPGTFAVFALGMANAEHAPLVVDYLSTVDGEHQSMQAKFVEAYIDAHGFTPEAVAYLVACAGNIQHLRHRKIYSTLISNKNSLQALLELRSTGQPESGISALKANLSAEPVTEYSWRAALYAIWGEPAEREEGRAIIEHADPDLRPLIERVFA